MSVIYEFLPQIGGAIAVLLAFLGIRASGANKVRRQAAEKKADALEARMETTDEISGMDDERVSSELNKWVRTK